MLSLLSIPSKDYKGFTMSASIYLGKESGSVLGFKYINILVRRWVNTNLDSCDLLFSKVWVFTYDEFGSRLQKMGADWKIFWNVI